MDSRHALFLLLAGAMACSPRPPQLDCDTLGLASPGAVPGSWVPILGADTAALAAVEMTIRADTTTMPALVLAQDDGSAVLVAPAHPSGRLEGGAVTVVFGECAPMAFAVEPLEPAPGEVKRLMGMARQQIVQGLAQFGTTALELQQSDPDSLHPLMAVLGGLLEIVDAYAPDAAQVAEQHSGGGAIIEAMLGHHGLVDQLAMAQAAQQAHSGATRSLFVLASARQDPPPGIGNCARPVQTAPAAADVACWMRAALFHEMATTGKPAAILSVLGTTLSVGAALPVPVANQAFVVSGIAVLAYAATAQAISRLLPRRFTGLEVRPSPASQDEDANKRVRWRDQIRATASSDTWDPSSALVDLTSAGLTSRNDVLGNGFLARAIPAEELRTAVLKNLSSLFGPMPITSAMKGQMEGVAIIGPVAYTDIDVSQERWTEGRVIGDAFQIGGGGELVPRQAGSATLRVTIKPSEFSGQTYSTDESVTIQAIVVRLTPTSVALAPGGRTLITAQVENAQDTRLEWTIEPRGRFDVGVRAGGMAVEATAPARPPVLPAVITARSLADRTHLQSRPERTGNAQLRGTSLVVVPEGACVLPGDELQMGVDVPETDPGFGDVIPAGLGDPADYDWKASTGSIDEGGVFRAPRSGSGTATITATEKDDAELTGDVEVPFGTQCRCYGSVSLGAPVGRSYVGLAAWRQRDGQFTIGFTPAMSDREALANPARRLELGTVYSGTPSVGNHTLRQATLAGFLNAENQIYGVVDPTSTGTGSGIVSLKRVDADQLDGTFVGYISVLMRDPGTWVQAPVTFTFRALRGSKTAQGPFLECFTEATGGGG